MKIFASTNRYKSDFLVKLHDSSANVFSNLNFYLVENYCNVVMKSHNDTNRGNAIMTYVDVESKELRYVKVPGTPTNARGEFLLNDEFFALQYDI